jgi:hypothetical protein
VFEPTDVNSMQEVATLTHEYYLNLRSAGFSRHEALHIVNGTSCCNKEGNA